MTLRVVERRGGAQQVVISRDLDQLPLEALVEQHHPSRRS